MKALKTLFVAVSFALSLSASGAERVNYRCQFYGFDGELSEAFLDFTVFGEVCSKSYSYFGEERGGKTDFISCDVVKSTKWDLIIRFLNADAEFLSDLMLTMSPQLLFGRVETMSAWLKCERRA